MLIDFLHRHSDSHPEKICIQSETISISFSVFVSEISTRGKILRNIGVQQDDRVGILLDDSIESIISVYSCFLIGAIPVLLPNNHTEIEISNMIRVTNPSVILTSWGLADKTNSVDIPVFPIEELSQGYGGCGPTDLSHSKSLDDVALILFTSGTTGTPKAVQLSERNIIESASNWHDQLEFHPSDNYLHCLPIHHIGGISIFFRAMIYGFKVTTVSFDVNAVIHAIQNQSVSWVSVVPTILDKLLSHNTDFKSNDFRGFILSGSSSSEALLNTILTHDVPVYKSYGMTETSSGICGFWVHEYPSKFDSVGHVFKNVNCKIKHTTLRVDSSCNMVGYINEEPITTWLDTQDIARIDSDGFIFIESRLSDTIVSGGENIDPEEIRQCILSYPQVMAARVFSKPHEKWGDIVVAEVQGQQIELTQLKQFLKQRLSPYKIPKEIIEV